MRLYLEAMRLSFRRYRTYTSANVAGLITNAFFGVVRSYVFIALYRGRGTAQGYNLHDALTYVWLSQALIMPVLLWGWQEIALTVRSGDIASDLARPFDYFGFWLSRDYGRACYHVLYRSVPTLVLGWLLFQITIPLDPWKWLPFAASFLLAVTIGFCIRFMINVSAFWFTDIRGVLHLSLIAVNFLSGMLVPLAFFPPIARTVAEALPFAGLINTPVNLYLGQAAGSGALLLLLRQAAWTVALVVASQLLLGLGTRKLVVQGG